MPWVDIAHVLGTDRQSLDLQVVENKLDIALADVGHLRQHTATTKYLHFQLLAIGTSLEQAVDQLLKAGADRSEEHTSELQSLMRISYAVFCLKKKNIK